LQLADKNPDALHLSLPEVTPKGISEASLGSVSTDPGALALGNQIGRALKTKTKGGMWVRSRNGAEAYVKWTCYSPGIEQLASKGTPLLAIAGASAYEIRSSHDPGDV
jgi:hypothetical protein